MTWIKTIPEAEATGVLADAYAHIRQHQSARHAGAGEPAPRAARAPLRAREAVTGDDRGADVGAPPVRLLNNPARRGSPSADCR